MGLLPPPPPTYLFFLGSHQIFIQVLRWVRHSESDPIDLLICGSKKTTKNLPKRNGEGGGRCLGTPTRPGWRVSAFRPTHRHHPHPSPMLRHQHHPLSSLPRLPVCHHHPRASPHPPYKVMRRDCPGLRVGPAHVVAHRSPLPYCSRPPHTHICCVVLVGGRGLMSIYYVCCPKLPVYNDTTTKKRASSERFTQSLFKKRS